MWYPYAGMNSGDDDDDDDKNDNHDDHVGDDDDNDNVFECAHVYNRLSKHQSMSTIVLLKTTLTQKIMLQATYL